jgi:tRNA threonylcarbamoyladenosine biosynthesis protein TsaB
VEAEEVSMKGVLAIDTAGPVVGVGYYDPQQSRCWEQRIVRGTEKVLFNVLQGFLEDCSFDLVAVTVGPGAFTSLRVGVSTALGLAMSRGLGVVPVSSLLARASLVRQANTLALLDARKSRVYAQLFHADQHPPKPLTAEADAPLEEVIPKGPFWAIGEGALVYRAAIEERGGKVPTDAGRSPVLEVARYADRNRGLAEDPATISLNYLRPPDATPPRNLGTALGRPRTEGGLNGSG